MNSFRRKFLKVPTINGFYISPGTFLTDVKRSVQSRLKLYKRQPPKNVVGNQPVVSPHEAQNDLTLAILSGTPFAAGRLGTLEGDLLSWRIRHPRRPFPLGLLMNAKRIAGVFPVNQRVASDFVDSYLESAGNLDLLGVRNQDFFSGYFKMETTVIEKTRPKALCSIEAFQPLGEEDSWVESLSGKRVLIIHPFASTIRHQYLNNRFKIYPNKFFLPDFRLEVFAPLQTGGDKDPLGEPSSWKLALNAMLQDISKISFDVALIAAGAYGLVLASEIKKTGKVAIHIGGVLQLFFGIRGGRFDAISSQYESLALYHTDAWVRPSNDETPDFSGQVEGGAYW
jgi:hypothetical protein